MTFDECFEVVMEIEGFAKVSDDPDDNGGLTKWGISEAAYPDMSTDEILALTKTKAKAIYKRDYWDAISAVKLPIIVRLSVFDAAVNHGVLGAGKLIQKAVNQSGANLIVDGIIGPISQAAIKKMLASEFLENFSMERLKFYQKLSDFNKFGNGWTRRLFKVAIKTV